MNSNIRELTTDDLNRVAGGDFFFGANCSQTQQETIGGIVGGLENIPIIGGALADIATAIGRGICG